MDNINIRNIVIFKPTGADFYHNLAYKELAAEHLNEERFLNFEYKGNRIASFDAEEQPSLSVETEPITRTTTLSLRDNKPIVVIQGKAPFALFSKPVTEYSTVPISSSFTEGLKIKFRPTCLWKQDSSVTQRYSITDEQNGTNLGVLLVPCAGPEMALAFEEFATETQRRLIIGTSAFIIADVYRAKYLSNAFAFGLIWGFVLIFMIVLYFQ